MTTRMYTLNIDAYCPDWLEKIMGHREWAVMHHPRVKVCWYSDGERLPRHQPMFVTPDGNSIWIDIKRQQIIG